MADFGFADLEKPGLVRFRREPLSDRLPDVGQGFLDVLALRVAAAQRRLTHPYTGLMLDQRDPVFHGSILVLCKNQFKPDWASGASGRKDIRSSMPPVGRIAICLRGNVGERPGEA